MEQRADYSEVTPDSEKNLLEMMEEASAKMEEEDKALEQVERERLEQDASANLSKKISTISQASLHNLLQGNHQSPKARTPITDEILKQSSPSELVGLALTSARKGKEWAIRLLFQYLQSPETLLRLNTDSQAPIRIESLTAIAIDLGINLNDVLSQGEAAIREKWVNNPPAEPPMDDQK